MGQHAGILGQHGKNLHTGHAGQIQAIKVRDTYTLLPRNARYLILYRDFSGYDEATETGWIRIYDLNYDEFLAAEGKAEKGVIIELKTYAMPGPIAEKYKFGEVTGEPIAEKHFCDKNNNGNVSFGECFSCLAKACNDNWECKVLCMLANSVSRACAKTIGLSCIWIAIFY